jgi:hypothetical protein
MKHQTCSRCGCSLDYGEKCDCESKEAEKLKILESLFQKGIDGQMEVRYEIYKDKD